MKTYHTSIFADFFQFYLHDSRATSVDRSEDAFEWDEKNLQNLLVPIGNTVAFGTLRNMDVSVTIHIDSSVISVDPDEW